jgi:hypothetical protein
VYISKLFFEILRFFEIIDMLVDWDFGNQCVRYSNVVGGRDSFFLGGAFVCELPCIGGHGRGRGRAAAAA